MLFPSNLLRTWHLQLAIFWIATAYLGGALFVASILAERDSPGLRRGTNLLFAAMMLVIVGSLLGEWAGLRDWLPRLWFWLGDQGWEYLEIGRLWQYALILSLVFWFYLLWRALSPARRDPERRELANFLLSLPVDSVVTASLPARRQFPKTGGSKTAAMVFKPWC